MRPSGLDDRYTESSFVVHEVTCIASCGERWRLATGPSTRVFAHVARRRTRPYTPGSAATSTRTEAYARTVNHGAVRLHRNPPRAFCDPDMTCR